MSAVSVHLGQLIANYPALTVPAQELLPAGAQTLKTHSPSSSGLTGQSPLTSHVPASMYKPQQVPL